MGVITLGQAAGWCGGQVDEKFENLTFLGACGDHRWAQPGELFVTLEDGPHTAEQCRVALEKGAVAVLTKVYSPLYPCLVVGDPRRALGDIARQERKRIGMQVVGVTGSRGKTTVTEMVSAVLSGSFRVGRTLSNQFNDIGVPMAILAMAEDTQVAVLEMGMDHYREIAYLASVARPDIAVITNIGSDPENFPSREAVLQAKLEILEGMREDGTVILNGDDDLLWQRRNSFRVKTRSYGLENPACDLLGREVRSQEGVGLATAVSRQLQFPLELSRPEEFFISDALAAVAVGLKMGVQPSLIQERLAALWGPGEQPVRAAVRGLTGLFLGQNAGPDTMTRALQALQTCPQRRIAVVGDLLELGVCTQAEHYRIGRICAECADLLLAYGPNSQRTVSGAVTGGMPAARALAFGDGEKLLRTLDALAKPGDTVLFAGGRKMHMRRLWEGFLAGS